MTNNTLLDLEIPETDEFDNKDSVDTLHEIPTINFCYLLQVDGDPEFRLTANSARKDGATAEFTAAGWVYQSKEDAEKVAKRWSNGKRKIQVVRWIDLTLDKLWYGSKDESKIAKKQISLELSEHLNNKKKLDIELECYISGLHWSWLYKDSLPEDMSDKDKKTHAHYKPLWEKTIENQEKITLKQSDISMEEEDVKNTNKDGFIIEPGKIHDAVNAAEKLLKHSSIGVYQRSKTLVRLIEAKHSPKKKILDDEKGKRILSNNGLIRSPESLTIEEIDLYFLLEILTKIGIWKKYDARSNDYKIIDCPEKIAKHLLSRKQWENIPVLRGIIQSPTILKDGSILQKPGYDETSGLYFQSSTKFPKILEKPSKEDALSSLTILKEILKGFPFSDEIYGKGKNFSVALSAILTALIRKSISSAPLHGFSAPKMGSGKSLLADVVSLISTGSRNCVVPPEKNEAEEKKRLMALLMEGDSIACYDNIVEPFSSAALCCALTQPYYKDRILGKTGSATAPTDITFLATGNNLRFAGDLSTRALLCVIDANEERPEERSFDINLYEHIPKNRGEIVVAALTVLKAYIHAGKPKQKIKTYGRFEEWSDLVRSAIIWVGCADPCESRKEIEDDDPERVKIGNLFASWHTIFGDYSQKVKDVVKKAEIESKEGNEDLLDALLEMAPDNKGGVNPRSLGKQLAKHNKRIECGYQLEKMAKIQHAETWRIKKI